MNNNYIYFLDNLLYSYDPSLNSCTLDILVVLKPHHTVPVVRTCQINYDMYL